MAQLTGKRIACVATDGFEYTELTGPKQALEHAGAEVDVISPKEGSIQGETRGEKAGSVSVDRLVSDADPNEYGALLLPGGVGNPDKLRMDESAVAFVRHFVEKGKPIAAICHGPWTLINASGVKGRRMTSWPSLQIDLENAGAIWEDSEVVHDSNLITSRKPDDIPVFNETFIGLLTQA